VHAPRPDLFKWTAVMWTSNVQHRWAEKAEDFNIEWSQISAHLWTVQIYWKALNGSTPNGHINRVDFSPSIGFRPFIHSARHRPIDEYIAEWMNGLFNIGEIKVEAIDNITVYSRAL
jgi:hypothetical protein